MKRAIIIILGLGAAHFGGRLQAQQPAPPSPAAPEMTKIGVINLIQLCEKCNRVKALEETNKKEIEPFNQKREKINEIVAQWQKALNNKDLKDEKIREKGFEVLKEAKRQLEDLDFQLKTEVFKRFEGRRDEMTKQINKVVREYCMRNNYHLVVAYGDPSTPLAPVTAYQRNAAAMDKGLARPIYNLGYVDITQEVLTELNR